MITHTGRPLWKPALLILALSLAGPTLAAKSSPQRPDLSGAWKLNEEMTARMMEALRKERRGGPMERPPGGMRRPSGGGRPGGGGGGRRGGMGGPGMRESGARPSLEALDELALTQTAETLTIIDKTGRQRVLRLGGRKTRDESAPGGPEELKAKWSKDGSLVVYVKPKEGPKRTETYMVSNDRKRLFLTLSLEGRGPGIKLRRVYDAVPPEPAVEEPASEPQGLQSCRPTTRTVLVVGSSSADFCRPMS